MKIYEIIDWEMICKWGEKTIDRKLMIAGDKNIIYVNQNIKNAATMIVEKKRSISQWVAEIIVKKIIFEL